MSDSFGRYPLGPCTTGGCPPNLLTSASGNLAFRFTQQASQRSPKTSQRSPIQAKSNKLSASQFQEALLQIRSFPAGESHAISGLPGAFSWSSPAAAFVGELPQDTAFGFWMPQPLPTRTWHCVASSRLGQKLAANRTLLEALERTADSLRSKPVVVLYARSFALAAHLRALSQRAELTLPAARDTGGYSISRCTGLNSLSQRKQKQHWRACRLGCAGKGAHPKWGAVAGSPPLTGWRFIWRP
jgi:hypothetical protein